MKLAALLCAAGFARQRGDEATARFLEDYADFLECHVEAWTVTTQGTLVPGINRHYIRINPVSVADCCPDEDPNTGTLVLSNRPPETQYAFPAKEIVDAGFLELVRYGIRRADDPIIVDSLKVIDAMLKTDTPFGPCWHRYNHDGYGQRNDGSGYDGWGTGRAWPLLTGERGHYELAAGRSPAPFSACHGVFCHLDRIAARASVGHVRSTRIPHVLRKTHWGGHAFDVGSRRIYQAPAFGLRRQSL